MEELRKDLYNRSRYKILSAVAVLNSIGCVANSKNVFRLTGLTYTCVCERLNSMANRGHNNELIAKLDPEKTKGCILQYSLSAHGERTLQRYQERHENGETLRLRWEVPFKVDYSDFVLLPGLKEQHEIQDETHAEWKKVYLE